MPERAYEKRSVSLARGNRALIVKGSAGMQIRYKLQRETLF